MAYITINASQTDAGSPVDQTLMDAIRNNLDYLNAGLTSIQQSARLFDHFDWHPGDFSTRSFDAVHSGVNTITGGVPPTADWPPATWGRDWVLASDLGDASSARNGTKPAFSVNRLSVPNSAAFSYAQSKLQLQQNSITGTMVLEARVKISTDNDLRVGMTILGATRTTDIFAAPTNGIYLSRVDATNYVFSTKDGGGTTTGTNFAKPTLGTWFVVRLEFSASNACACYINGSLKDTLTTHLDAASPLCATLGVKRVGSAADFDIDRCELSCGGLSDAP